MKAPDKIYVPQHNIEAGNIQELRELIVEGSVEYIRKDSLLEWAKDELDNVDGINFEEDNYEAGLAHAIGRVIEKLNLL